MDQIMESVLCVQYTDEPRIRNIIQQAIDAGEIPSYNAFVKESKQKMNARKRRVRFWMLFFYMSVDSKKNVRVFTIIEIYKVTEMRVRVNSFLIKWAYELFKRNFFPLVCYAQEDFARWIV